MLIICTVAISTIGSTYAATNNQQSAENITNSALNYENTANNLNPVENSSTDLQNSVQSTDNVSQTTVSTSSTQDTTQNVSNTTKTTEDNITQTTQNITNITSNASLNSQNSADTQTNSAVSTASEYSVSTATNTTNLSTVNNTTNIQEQQFAAGDIYTNIRGIWLKAEDVGNITVSELKNANITDIFVKANLFSTPTYQSVLTSILSKFQNSGIRIHAWITCFKDANGNWIDPANATQRATLLNAIKDIITNYNVDGIFLDYVRYSGVGSNAAYNYPNATATITSFVSDVKQLILTTKPKVALSATLMPEGATNAYYYGQDYAQLAQYLDFLVPMIYKGNYGQNTTWIGSTVKYIVSQAGGKPVIAGLQTYISDYDTTRLSASELNQDIKSAVDNGASGYALYRYGMISQDFLTPPRFTTSDIQNAAAKVKAYIESNHKLPNYVTIGTTQVTMPEFLRLLVVGLLQLNSKITTPITLKDVGNPNQSSGTFTSGKIYKTAYLSIAQKIKSFIDSNGIAPNFATTSLGKIPYVYLVYMYSKILNFNRVNHYIPRYVTMSSTMKISSTISGLQITTIFTVDQIKSVATRVKAYIESNHALPNYVTIGTSQVKMPDFLRLMLISTIEINDGSKALISLKTINAPAQPSENITSGNITQAGYIDLAKRVEAFVNANGILPNHATTSIGEVRYESLIYMYSKILSYYNTNNRLPSYVSVNPWSKISTGTIPTSLQQYLQATANCQVNDPRIKALAASITNGATSTYNKAVKIFNWVRDNISYSFYYNTKYGAVGTLNAKTGNCVDTTHLLIALERAAGIPARYVNGYCKFSSGNWYGHVWAQVWVNGKWYTADAISSVNTFGVINNWNTATATIYGTYASLPF